MIFVLRRWLGYLFFVCLAFLLSILGIWCLNKFDKSMRGTVVAKNRQGDWDKVHCGVPQWMKEKNFLEEVRYLNGLGFDLDLLDPELMGKLTKAFGQHPWVEKVVGIKREKDGLVLVELAFRKPALLLSSIETGSTRKTFRTVDRNGVLLPLDSPIQRLPLLVPDVPKALVKAGGTSLESKQIIYAASLVAFLAESMDLGDILVEARGNELYLRTVVGDLKCKWGAPVGMEPEGEPMARVKAKRLVAAFEKRDKMKQTGNPELDLTGQPGK